LERDVAGRGHGPVLGYRVAIEELEKDTEDETRDGDAGADVKHPLLAGFGSDKKLCILCLSKAGAVSKRIDGATQKLRG
jgi:hypothetical protein